MGNNAFKGLLGQYRLLHPIAVKKAQERSCVERILWSGLSNRFSRKMSREFGADIPLECQIGDGVLFVHEFHGIFIAGPVKIGRNSVICHHVTIGATFHRKTKPYLEVRDVPIIGENVFIGANATIIGRCVIGDGAAIGAGVTLVDAAIEPGEVVVDCSAYSLTKNRYVRERSGK